MKLRNKKTGEIYELNEFCLYDDKGFAKRPFLKTLAELNEDWEDYEEPKVIYYISWDGMVLNSADRTGWKNAKQIGNYFETKEEAEKAVEKLKAWKRLKDKGFGFEGIKEDFTRILQSQEPFRTGKRYLQFNKSEDEEWMKENWEDLDLLFGGEE
jgi:hypothetical protein